MRKLFHLLLAIVFLALIASADASTVQVVVSGQVVFAIDYKQSVMEERGYQFVGEGSYGRYVTNYFGAQDADIVIKNAKEDIVGVSKTKADGTFTLKVDKSTFYHFTIEWRGKKIEKTISSLDAIKSIKFDLGHFETKQIPMD